MTEINITDLLKMIKEHPDYEKCKDEVSVENALYISFHNQKINHLNSESYVLKNGNELILDLDSNGIVYGIEII
jgi:hypothetical protein